MDSYIDFYLLMLATILVVFGFPCLMYALGTAVEVLGNLVKRQRKKARVRRQGALRALYRRTR